MKVVAKFQQPQTGWVSQKVVEVYASDLGNSIRISADNDSGEFTEIWIDRRRAIKLRKALLKALGE